MLLPHLIGITVSDINRSLTFYRLLGLDFPDPPGDGDFVETTTPNGYRISVDALSLMKSMEPDWVAEGPP